MNQNPNHKQYSVEQFANRKRLFSLPEVAMRLLQIAQQETPDFAEISRIIRADPAICGKVLSTVNSALFGFKQKIETIEEAIQKIGLSLLRTILLGFHLSNNSDLRDDLQPVLLQDHWRSSLTQAVFAELLAERLQGIDKRSAFLAAMLQDIGILAMISAEPQVYKNNVLIRSIFPEVVSAERAFFGFSHVNVTENILKQWGMSECFGDAIKQHHDRILLQNRSRHQLLGVVLQAATQGTEMLFSNRNSPTDLATAVSHWGNFVNSQLGLSYEKAKEIVDMVPDRVSEYSVMFSFDIGEGVCANRVINEAKELLEEIGFKNQMESIQQAKKQQNKIDPDLLYRDSLCGLYNRRYLNDKFGEILQAAIDKQDSVAFYFIDIDKFKSVNDTYGHKVGDQAIKHVAQWLQKSIRSTDTAIRLSGDEFLIVLQKVPENNFLTIGDQIGDRIPAMRLSDDTVVPLSLSIGGVYYVPEKGDVADPNSLIDQADHSMYKSKRNGGGQRSMKKIVGIHNAHSIGGPIVMESQLSTPMTQTT
ncbi:MAG: HDOD domain-containing protein [Pirellulaceae bacterium]